jgi:beta-lactamase class A
MSGVIYARAFYHLLIARLTSDKPIQYFLQKIGWLNRFESLDAESRDGRKVK